mgnify:FL=1
MLEKPELLKIRNDIVTIDLPYKEGAEATNLTVAVAALGTSLTVLDNSSLAQNDYLIIGNVGDERTEIVRITAAVTAGTALTTTAVVFPHPIGTPITLIRYNQVSLYGSNDRYSLAPTIIGSATTLDVETGYNEITATTTYKYYFARYTNAQTSANSLYSEGVSDEGLAVNSKRKIKDSALGIANEKSLPALDEYLDTQFELCKQEIALKRRHWSFLKTTNQFNYKVLHNCETFNGNGTWVIGDDAENITTDTAGFKEGAGSVNFDIDVSDSANNYASLQNSTMASVDCTDFQGNGYIRFWVYIPSIIDFTSILIRWGSGTGAYWEVSGITKDVYNRPLHSGWNYLEAVWDEATITGSPDSRSINFLYVRYVYAAGYTDATDARIDWFAVFDKPFSVTAYSPIVTIAGVQEYDLPYNIQSKNDNDAIINVHVRNYEIMTYADPEQWRKLNESNIQSLLAADITTASTTINLADGADFATSGTIYIQGDSITYTGRTTNQLTGVTGITSNHFTGDPVYQQPNTGNPSHYSIQNGKIRLFPIPDTDYDTFNIYVDYYKDIDSTPYDHSTTEIPFYVAVVYYLAYKIYERKGKFDEADRFRLLYEKEVAEALRKESGGRRTVLRVRIPTLTEIDFDRSKIISR